MVVELKKQRHIWTPEEEVILRERYRSDPVVIDRLAEFFGVTRTAVKKKASNLMLLRTISTTRKEWTPNEERYLENNIGKLATTTIARKLRRSIPSVRKRADYLHLSRSQRDGWYSKTDVIRILAVDGRWIEARRKEGTLKMRPHNPKVKPRKHRGTWHIEADDLRDFIRRYPHELQGRNVDMFYLIDLLVGVKIPYITG